MSRGANFPHGPSGRFSSLAVSPFVPRSGLLRICCCHSKRRRLRRPSPHRRVAEPFRLWLIGSTYRPSGGVGLHRSRYRTIFSRRLHVTPRWSAAGDPLYRQRGESTGLVSDSSKGGDCRTTEAEDAVSRSLLAWPLRHPTFSGPPGGEALAAYLRR